MPDAASLDTLVMRLRSTNWTGQENELAQAIAVALSGVARQQTFNRGLHDNTLVDRNGGTTLKVGDNSVARTSVSLQPPQLGFLRKHGAVATRRQARAEAEVKTVPAKVLAVEGSGANVTLTVSVIGDKPLLATSPTSGQLTPGGTMADADFDSGTIYTVSMVGNTFASGSTPVPPEDEGLPALPTVGQTMNLTLSNNYEKTTTWIQRGNRHVPRVTEKVTSSGATAVNGLCCAHHDTGGGGDGGGT